MLLFILLFGYGCNQQDEDSVEITQIMPNTNVVVADAMFEEPIFCNEKVVVGAARFSEYSEYLKGKKIGVVGNQSSIVKGTHLVDTLLALNTDVVKVFSPEHGFRGDADAGEKVKDGVDPISGLPIISLYGAHKKPTVEDFKGIDVILFDLQDVGARFYTYISTLTYVMEACAENGVSLVVLDRPNPNGHYVDGPVLNENFTSFIGMHPVPVIHGLTIGEYAGMVNGEGWMTNGIQCDLKVVSIKGWDHSKFYEVPVKPSPNLPNASSIYLYPSLCFFEGTVVSIGRGTNTPFQIAGHPNYNLGNQDSLYAFTPISNAGASNPKLKNKECYGYDFRKENLKDLQKWRLDLKYLIQFYNSLGSDKSFFLTNNFIDLLYGSDELRKMMLAGNTAEEIEATWENDLEIYKFMRKDYLLYKDFE